MDYEEFLWAIGDSTTTPLIRDCFEARRPVGEPLNRKLLRDFRLYMLVGGMPQAVSEYIETNNFRKVDLVKRDILALYEEDFRKFDPSGRASRLFDAIPAQLAKNASRYQTSGVLKNSRTDRLSNIIAEMENSKTVLLSYRASDPNAGLSATEDLSVFKMFVCDTGLFVTLMFKDRDFTENLIYEKLLSDKLSANEVKSSGYKSHVSMDKFFRKYSSRVLQKYLVYPKDLAKDTDTLCIPIYMTQFL